MGALTHIVTGPIASFRSADKAPIESLKLHFLPKQEGSGDPSSQNIRNIVGWTGCNLFKAKKNLLDISTAFCNSTATLSNGIVTNNVVDTRAYVSLYVEAIKKVNTSYNRLKLFRMSGEITEAVHFTTGVLTVPSECEDMEYLRIKHNGSSKDFSIYFPLKLPVGSKFAVTLDITGADVSTVGGFSMSNFHLEVDTASDTLEQYEGSTIPLSWSEHGVVYGGYADPVRGKLVAEYEMLTDTWGNWGTAQDMGDGTTLRYKRFTNPVYGNSINNHHTDYCNVTKYNYTNENGNPHYYIVGQSYNCRVYMPNDFSTDQVIQVIGKLITPIEYDIDPITLQTFLDYNNFWTDMNDDTEVEYAFADRLSERKLIMDTPHIASAQGLVASFNTDLKAPIVDLKAYFTPVQEGTGDPSPQNKRPIHGWTGLNIRREGKNLIDKNSLVGTDKVWWKGKVIGGYPNHYATPMIPVKPGGTYYLNRDSGSQDYVCFFDKDGEYIEQQVWNTYSKTKTLGENVYYIGITIAPDYINSALLQFDSANTSYADYIDGAVIPIEFPATRNLLDTSTHETSTHIIKSGITFDYNSNGTLTVNGQVDSGATTGPQYRMALWTQQETGDYYLCCGAPYSAVYNEAYVYDSELSERPKKWDGVTQSQSAASNRPLSEVHLIAGHTYSINIRINRGQDKAYANDEFYVMLLRSTDTDTHYEPYGTIYGGYIDLIRGKIVNTYKKVRLDSFASSWYEESGPSGFFVLQYKIVFADRDKFVCNAYKPVSLPYWNSMPDLSIMGHPTMDDLLRIRDTSYAGDTAGFVANLTNIGAELAYPISTPIEYDLTPETLKSFIGQNNIWADTNGNVDVKYWTH